MSASAGDAALTHLGARTLPHAVTHVCSVRLAGAAPLLVAAGGTTVSVVGSDLGSGGRCESAPAAAAKGVGYLRSLLREGAAGAAPATAAPARLSLALTVGRVASLAVAALPGASGAASAPYALGVVGTTAGSVLVFLLGGGALTRLAERPLLEWSGGRVGEWAAVRDVRIVLDPAGRPELIVAATSAAVVAVDTQRVHPSLCAAAAQRSPLSLLRRGLSDVFVFSPPGAEVVCTLPPERRAAAFDADVAFLVVLADGDVRYVRRCLDGGSVALLREMRARRQSAPASAALDTSLVPAGASRLLTRPGDDDASGRLMADAPEAAPHVLYRYELTDVRLQARPATPAALRDGVCVNDAAIVYNPGSGAMSVVLVGAARAAEAVRQPQLDPRAAASATAAVDAGLTLGQLRRRQAGTDSGSGSSGNYSASRSATTTAAAAVPPPLGRAGALAWWCVIDGAVLPELTLGAPHGRARHYGHPPRGPSAVPAAAVRCFSRRLATSSDDARYAGATTHGPDAQQQQQQQPQGHSGGAFSAVRVLCDPGKGAVALCSAGDALHAIPLFQATAAAGAAARVTDTADSGASDDLAAAFANASVGAAAAAAAGDGEAGAVHFLCSVGAVVEAVAALPPPGARAEDGGDSGAHHRVPVAVAHGSTITSYAV